MTATEVIRHKRDGKALSLGQIQYFIDSYLSGAIADYQMASLLMAIFLRGMTSQETSDLTQVMLDSGVKIDFEPNVFPVDKHSTGGVGDKTSLILAPIVAAAGVPVPMMSGRGLGHTGGTLDKLESIPGFNVHLDLREFQKMVETSGLSFIGQTKDICPADKKIYSLRDVTGTVESLPLICASIMSKKIAEGIKGLCLDVKFGSGAFMKTLEDAKNLAENLKSIGESHGLEVAYLLSDMNQPLGRYVGNSVEIYECLSILKQQNDSLVSLDEVQDTQFLSLELAAQMIQIGKKVSLEEARAQAQKVLDDGSAFEKFAEVCKIQGGELNQLPMPTASFSIEAQDDGFLESFVCEDVGHAAIEIGAGRKKIEDPINPVSGIKVLKKIGDPIRKGEPIFSLLTDDRAQGLDQARAILNTCYSISSSPVEAPPLIPNRP